MADVELVIKIPEEYYNFIKEVDESNYSVTTHLYKAVYEGIILPKGHGRLIIEEDGSIHRVEDTKFKDGYNRYADSKHYHDYNAPTIIEADRGEEE